MLTIVVNWQFVRRQALDPGGLQNNRFLDKNALRRRASSEVDLGKGENTIGMLATTYNSGREA